MPRKKSGTFDQNKYVGSYIKEFIRYKHINFNLQKDDDKAVLDWIDSRPEGISNYLKRLVLQDIASQTKQP